MPQVYYDGLTHVTLSSAKAGKFQMVLLDVSVNFIPRGTMPGLDDGIGTLEEFNPGPRGGRAEISGHVTANALVSEKSQSDAHRLAWAVINGDEQAALLLADEVQQGHFARTAK